MARPSSFTTSHTPSITPRTVSKCLYSAMSPATRAATPATIHVMGLAHSAALKSHVTPVATLVAVVRMPCHSPDALAAIVAALSATARAPMAVVATIT